MQVNPSAVLKQNVNKQTQIGNKFIREVFDDEINDYYQIIIAIKKIEETVKTMNQLNHILNEQKNQYNRLMFGNSPMSSAEDQKKPIDQKTGLFGKIFNKDKQPKALQIANDQSGIIPANSVKKMPGEVQGAIEGLDQELIQQLENSMGAIGQKIAAYDVICHILVENILINDIPKLRQYRQKMNRRVYNQISSTSMGQSADLTMFYSHVLGILQ